MPRWYGPTSFDRSQILSFSYYLKLPAFGQKYLGNHKLVNSITDGWQFSGIFQAMTGGPIGNAIFSSDGKGQGNEYSAGINSRYLGSQGSELQGHHPGLYQHRLGQLRSQQLRRLRHRHAGRNCGAVLTCDPRKNLAKNQYFNPACFSGPMNLSNGSYRLPYIHGPAYINDSLGLFKAFAMGGSRKLEVRGEAFNLFNHPWNEFIQYDPGYVYGLHVGHGCFDQQQ